MKANRLTAIDILPCIIHSLSEVLMVYFAYNTHNNQPSSGRHLPAIPKSV